MKKLVLLVLLAGFGLTFLSLSINFNNDEVYLLKVTKIPSVDILISDAILIQEEFSFFDRQLLVILIDTKDYNYVDSISSQSFLSDIPRPAT